MAVTKGKSGGDSYQRALDQIKAQLGAGSAQPKDDMGPVYLGQAHPEVSSQARKNFAAGGVSSKRRMSVANWVSADAAFQEYFKWSEKKRKDFTAQAILGGLLKEGAGTMEASQIWRDLVAEASEFGRAGKKISPWDIMSNYVKQAGGNGSWVRQGDFEVNTVTGERRYVGPRFKTTTDKRVDLTDPQTAQAIATSIFQEMMGRAPKAGEIKAFASALSSAEKAHPVTTRTTTEFDMATGEAIGTDTLQQGGVTNEGRAILGQNQVKKKDEYGAYQAATTYNNALEQAVYGAPG